MNAFNMYRSNLLTTAVAAATLAATIVSAQNPVLTSLGCVNVDTTGADDGDTLANNSPLGCARYCAGYSYIAITEQFCSCFPNAPAILNQLDDARCNSPCPPPNDSEKCGGQDLETANFVYNYFSVASALVDPPANSATTTAPSTDSSTTPPEAEMTAFDVANPEDAVQPIPAPASDNVTSSTTSFSFSSSSTTSTEQPRTFTTVPLPSSIQAALDAASEPAASIAAIVAVDPTETATGEPFAITEEPCPTAGTYSLTTEYIVFTTTCSDGTPEMVTYKNVRTVFVTVDGGRETATEFATPSLPPTLATGTASGSGTGMDGAEESFFPVTAGASGREAAGAGVLGLIIFGVAALILA